jgi:Putative adhesin
MGHGIAKAAAALAACIAMGGCACAAWGAEATFTRDVTVNGRVDLTVATGSGSIHLTEGPGGHVHIVGRVRSSWGADESQVQQIADHPPVEQTGNIVRVGAQRENWHNISIDYEIEAPADAFLTAQSGSGNVDDGGVGANARLSTGSGSIHATGLAGAPSLDTGSGNIYAELKGDGDARAQTGSGSIELHGLHGALRAETGSGNVKVDGKPLGPWKVTTGSGSVELWTADSPFTLDAQTGSGSIHSDREMLTQGTEEHHHVTGKISGGGPTVRIETGSGSIRIH